MSLVQKFAVWALPVLFAITLHEVAHGWVARVFGDHTAEEQGRLSLNPLRHIDPIGTIVVPALLLFLGGFLFGWAKPVPVDPRRMHHPRRDMAIVAAAGPAANLAMAVGWAVVARLGFALLEHWAWAAVPMILMGQAGIAINLILMVLNLLPLPPLDGGRILAGVVPPRVAYHLAQIEPYGLMVLVVLLALGWLGRLLSPPYTALYELITRMFGLNL
ncbi:MAG TPA: site-2 protease family protein [Chromatiales bacterium]|nr:site-2 protease family protein [Chromatiales bacterium]